MKYEVINQGQAGYKNADRVVKGTRAYPRLEVGDSTIVDEPVANRISKKYRWIQLIKQPII